MFICILVTLTSHFSYLDIKTALLGYFLICYLPGVQKQVKKNVSTTCLLLHIKFLPLWIVGVMKIKVLKQPAGMPNLLLPCNFTCCSTTAIINGGLLCTTAIIKDFNLKVKAFQVFACSAHLHANTQRSLWDLSCF